MKRILFFDHDENITGSTISLRYIMEYLIKKNIAVYVCTLKTRKTPKLFSDLGAKVIKKRKLKNLNPFYLPIHFGYEWEILSLNGFKIIINSIRCIIDIFLSLPAIIYRIKPDLIYINEHVSIHCAVLGKLLRIPVIMHVRSRLLRGRFGIRTRIIRTLARFSCDAIIGITHLEAEQYGSINNTQVRVVPEFLNNDNFQHPVKENYIKEKFGIHKGKLIVTLLGGIEEIKGTLLFLELAEKIKSNRNDVLFAIAGSESQGEYYNECFRYINEFKLFDFIRILGFIQNPLDLLAVSTVVVSATKESHFSRPIIEAWALKKAVLATAVAHNKELINHMKNGILSSNKGEMINYLNLLLKSTELRTKLGYAGYKTAQAKFNAQMVIPKIFNVVQDLVK